MPASRSAAGGRAVTAGPDRADERLRSGRDRGRGVCWASRSASAVGVGVGGRRRGGCRRRGRRRGGGRRRGRGGRRRRRWRRLRPLRDDVVDRRALGHDDPGRAGSGSRPGRPARPGRTLRSGRRPGGPPATIAWSAAAPSLSFRSGTGTVPGPVATVTLIAVPASTFVPVRGSWVRTVPCGLIRRRPDTGRGEGQTERRRLLVGRVRGHPDEVRDGHLLGPVASPPPEVTWKTRKATATSTSERDGAGDPHDRARHCRRLVAVVAAAAASRRPPGGGGVAGGAPSAPT